MHWYNYIFAAVAALGILLHLLLGLPIAARKGNVAAIMLGFLTFSIWVGVFYFNVFYGRP